MKVSSINNYYLSNHSKSTNFNGKFIMNESLYLHNILASDKELNTFRNTLKKIGTVDDNLRFSLEAGKSWYKTLSNGIWGHDFAWNFKLFKQAGEDETTKEQLGNTIFTQEFEPNEDGYAVMADKDYKVVDLSELLIEISSRLKKFYSHQKIFGMFNDTNEDKNALKEEINAITIPNYVGMDKFLDSLELNAK